MGQKMSSNRDSHSDRNISKQQKEAARQERAKIKLLLLGAGESGKSAIFKQMKILYGGKPTEEELVFYRSVIYSNIGELMRGLCEGADTLGVTDQIQAAEERNALMSADKNLSLSAPSPLGTQTIGALIAKLWQDPGIQNVWKRRAELQIVDSHKVFMDEIEAIRAHDYLPTVAHSVLARVRSTGVVTNHFHIDGNVFELYDVGGQRNERRKWMHVFDNVDAIIFVAALSEYDQTCFEDNQKNRMQEALEIFDWITHDPSFLETSVILFLNKKDLFQEKLGNSPINKVDLWSDFEGGDNYDAGVEYFKKKFEEIYAVKPEGVDADVANKEVYTHVTCATDPHNIHHVFNSCKDLICSQNLSNAGLM